MILIEFFIGIAVIFIAVCLVWSALFMIRGDIQSFDVVEPPLIILSAGLTFWILLIVAVIVLFSWQIGHEIVRCFV